MRTEHPRARLDVALSERKVKPGTAEKCCLDSAAEQRYTQGIGYLKMYSAERVCG